MTINERIRSAEHKGHVMPTYRDEDSAFRMSALNKNGIGGRSHFFNSEGYEAAKLIAYCVIALTILSLLIKYGVV